MAQMKIGTRFFCAVLLHYNHYKTEAMYLNPTKKIVLADGSRATIDRNPTKSKTPDNKTIAKNYSRSMFIVPWQIQDEHLKNHA